MISALDIAATGLSAGGRLVEVAAHNLANGETPGYTARRADLVELSDGRGVGVAGVRDTGQPVDLATELVQLKRGQHLYAANAAVVRVADEMVGTLLDVVAGDGRRGRRER